jgi:hypothetical protein
MCTWPAVQHQADPATPSRQRFLARSTGGMVGMLPDLELMGMPISNAHVRSTAQHMC